MSGRVGRVGIVIAALAALALPSDGFAQQGYSSGQTIAPAYEGWEQNDDGSFNLVFGYMNRNWEEVIDVPVGPGNNIEPRGPDRGQPTHFYPRRNRFIFRVRVPADFGDQELVWTLTTNGRTERAYATLKRDYYIDGLVIQANYGAGGGAGTTPELPDNQAPTLDFEGGDARTVRARRAAGAGGGLYGRRQAARAVDARVESALPGPLHDRHGHRSPPVVVRLPRRRRGGVRIRRRPRSGKTPGIPANRPGRPGGRRPPRPRTGAGSRHGHVRRAGRLRAARHRA